MRTTLDIPEEDGPAAGEQPAPTWYAALRPYARNARGQYDMTSIRRSIALGRAESATAKPGVVDRLIHAQYMCRNAEMATFEKASRTLPGVDILEA